MTTVAEVIGVSRSNLMERMRERPKKRIGRRPLPDGKLVAEIKAVMAELPTGTTASMLVHHTRTFASVTAMWRNAGGWRELP